ncbi:unnamed protein product [Rotaria socialis]|uniref:Swt1-like HEPN domain-containing protein n=1 Tax=Rotaria socialis TaxID=392032 RepID=A0A821VKH6_9BILA|nr:unnamed protein product [Rotaria socialis]CAF3476225.1 unnamed protein product [Rotaria socialis]CAF3489226.1 unnamed protein product [Rotaria socialis]CAF3589536.1 unnamed protein product [Rotaria socialis]CAF4468204.1 unnamed protein product [Rotaria socialis]
MDKERPTRKRPRAFDSFMKQQAACEERATHAGSLLKIIYLLTPQLRSFTVSRCENVDKALCQFIHPQDFLEILHFIKKHWNDVFAPQCYYTQGQKRIIYQGISTRNRICHQEFQAVEYIRSLDKLKKLAFMINDLELISLINDDFRRVSGNHGPLPGQVIAQMDKCGYEPQGFDGLDPGLEGDDRLRFDTPEEAIKYYSEQIFCRENDATSYYKRSIYECELKQYDLALEDLEEAVDLDKREKTYIDRRNRLLFQLKRESNFRPLFHWFFYPFMWLFQKLSCLVSTADFRDQQFINKISNSDEAIDTGASFYYGEHGLEKNLALAQKCWSKFGMEKDQEI